MEVWKLKNILTKNLYGISWEMNFYMNVFVARPSKSQSWIFTKDVDWWFQENQRQAASLEKLKTGKPVVLEKHKALGLRKRGKTLIN